MKLFFLILTVFFCSNAFAVKIDPLRYDSNEIFTARENGRGFVQGQIQDVFSNQVLYCTLVQLDPGMAHVIAVTLSGGQGRFYEYIDLDSEGMYKILSKGKVQVTEDASTVAVVDSMGGHIDFTGAVRKNGEAQIKLKSPQLTVNEPVSCWREK